MTDRCTCICVPCPMSSQLGIVSPSLLSLHMLVLVPVCLSVSIFVPLLACGLDSSQQIKKSSFHQ